MMEASSFFRMQRSMGMGKEFIDRVFMISPGELDKTRHAIKGHGCSNIAFWIDRIDHDKGLIKFFCCMLFNINNNSRAPVSPLPSMRGVNPRNGV